MSDPGNQSYILIVIDDYETAEYVYNEVSFILSENETRPDFKYTDRDILKDGEWQSIFLAHHIIMKIDENGQYVIDITIALQDV